VAALQSNCNIIPIIDNFQWPEPEELPEDMRAVCHFNGVRYAIRISHTSISRFSFGHDIPTMSSYFCLLDLVSGTVGCTGSLYCLRMLPNGMQFHIKRTYHLYCGHRNMPTDGRDVDI
jgi:hypothetical protein